MSVNRIQDRDSSNYHSRGVGPGDLVRLDDYYFDDTNRQELENFTGIVTRYMNSDEVPPLLEVFWTDGTFENLYEDELSKLEGV